ncbi:MAG: hypothetical protein KBD78_15010 [Oligoflexales bacterium]|nr:hypothetical protein [Oligoflexales bacterium]
MNAAMEIQNSNDLQGEITHFRASFLTWLTKKQFFASLALFSQVQIIYTGKQRSLASILVDHGIYIRVNAEFFQLWHEDERFGFFVMMHELRHITQFHTTSSWDHLIDFSKLYRALETHYSRSELEQYGFKDSIETLELKNTLSNIAADAAIHEDLRKLFEGDIIADLNAARTRIAREKGLIAADEKIDMVTVEDLEKLLDQKLDRSQDWLYYCQQLVVKLSHRIKSDRLFAGIFVENRILEYFSLRSFDLNEFADDASVELELKKSEIVHASLVEAAEADGEVIYNIHYIGGDAVETYQARRKLNQMIKNIIQYIQSCIKRGESQKIAMTRSYRQPHRFIAEAPGTILRSRREDKAEQVIVFDTSGSMWYPQVLSQMATLAYFLERKKVIKRAYCCDVELHRLDSLHSKSVEFKGAGATYWTRGHHDQILADLGTTQKITIYYCTDGDVYGLADARKDPRVNLVEINIPALINEGLLNKANL